MLIVVLAFSIPIAVFHIFLVPLIPDLWFMQETSVAAFTVAVALVLYFQYSEVKSSVQRIKGF